MTDTVIDLNVFNLVLYLLMHFIVSCVMVYVLLVLCGSVFNTFNARLFITHLQWHSHCGCHMGVQTPPKIQVGVSNTHTIVVYLVTCNWLLNCTTGVFRSLGKGKEGRGGGGRMDTPNFEMSLHPCSPQPTIFVIQHHF